MLKWVLHFADVSLVVWVESVSFPCTPQIVESLLVQRFACDLGEAGDWGSVLDSCLFGCVCPHVSMGLTVVFCSWILL